MIISIKKSSILINNREKNPPAAGLPPGRLLKRRAGLRRPAARGLNSVSITSNLDLLKILSENGSKPSKNDQQMIQNSQKMIKLGT